MQERVDDARSKLAETRSEQKGRTATIKQIEERQSRIETPASGQKYLDDTLCADKSPSSMQMRVKSKKSK